VRERRAGKVFGVSFEIGAGLAREPDDDVGADGGVRQAIHDAPHQSTVSGEGIRTTHLTEHAVAGVLERQVKVRGEPASGTTHQIHDGGGAVHRLERTETVADITRKTVEGLEKFQE